MTDPRISLASSVKIDAMYRTVDPQQAQHLAENYLALSIENEVLKQAADHLVDKIWFCAFCGFISICWGCVGWYLWINQVPNV